MNPHRIAVAVLLSLVLGSAGKAQDRAEAPKPALVLYAAGSLRAPIHQIADEYQKQTGIRIEVTFGASGLLRERIEHGERPDILASADMDSPKKLADQKLGTPPTVFTANAVCAVAPSGLDVDASKLLDVLLDPKIKIGTAMPIADPLGDYTETVFANADRIHLGAKAILDHRAVRLTGAPNAPKAPPGEEATSYFLLRGKQVDIMLTYCSGAQEAVRAEPMLRIIQLPSSLSVHAIFGYTLIEGSKPEAADFGHFLESDAAQEIFLKSGFLKK